MILQLIVFHRYLMGIEKLYFIDANDSFLTFSKHTIIMILKLDVAIVEKS